MPEREETYRVFVSAAEPSADSHCAGLITALRQSGYDIDFVGVGGPKMASAGCRLLETTAGRAAMIYKAFSHIGRYYMLIRRIRRFLQANKIDLVIVCDSPAFNFHIAKAAKKLGIKTLFYVAPQLWAWAEWRISKLRKCCDKLCCILPFEKDWFGRRGVETVFVGHPMFEALAADLRTYKKNYRGFDPNDVVMAIMPGSRVAEIESLWKPMQQIALHIKQRYPGAGFVTVAVDQRRKQLLQATQIEGFDCEYTIGSVSETANTVDFTIVASGSATLQVAAVGCPMVIMYQSSRVMWHLIGRWLVRMEYLSLVNILADRQLAPEFMPHFGSIGPIVEAVDRLLQDRKELAQLSAELIELAQPLRGGDPSAEVAKVVVEMLG